MSDDKHNSGPLLAEIARRVRNRLRRVRKASLETLAELRDVGEDLARAREVMTFDGFVEWVRREFDYGKTWALKLMELHRRWEEVQEAIEWAGDRPAVREAIKNVFTAENAVWLADLRRREAEGSPGPAPEDGALVRKKETVMERLKRERDSAFAEGEGFKEHVALLEARLLDNGIEPPSHEAVRTTVARKMRAQADTAEAEREIAGSGPVRAAPPVTPRTAGRKKRREPESRRGKRRRLPRLFRLTLRSLRVARRRKWSVPKHLARTLRELRVEADALRTILAPKLEGEPRPRRGSADDPIRAEAIRKLRAIKLQADAVQTLLKSKLRAKALSKRRGQRPKLGSARRPVQGKAKPSSVPA